MLNRKFYETATSKLITKESWTPEQLNWYRREKLVEARFASHALDRIVCLLFFYLIAMVVFLYLII